jgi:hypothetical protein
MSYSEEDIPVASQIISSYFEGRAVQQIYSQLGEEIPLFDIERDVEVFSAEIQFANRVGVPIPCLPLGIEGDRLAPVSFAHAFGFPSDIRTDYRIEPGRRILFEEMFLRYGSPSDFEQPQAYTPASTDIARNSFISLATEFLATRITSLRRSDGPRSSVSGAGGEPTLWLSSTRGAPAISTPGCLFTVTTNSPGLRVHWSGAYYIAPNYFSSPTSPVTSILQSGTYIFGVDGGAYSVIQWDTTAIVSLPGSPLLHLNY